MKKEQLIKEVQEKVPDGVEVVIFDERKNVADDWGEGSSSGIYKKFEVVQFTKEEIADGCIPFAALIFENDDYDQDNNNIHESKPFMRVDAEIFPSDKLTEVFGFCSHYQCNAVPVMNRKKIVGWEITTDDAINFLWLGMNLALENKSPLTTTIREQFFKK